MAETYKARTDATNTNALNDSYIRAFRWASDRIGEQGIVCFVSGGGWLAGAAADGMRRSLVDEFAEIYVLDLRGNQRTQGDMSRREGGKIFGGGSRSSIAITLLVKKKDQVGPGCVHYHDIGDYLSREDKLSKLVELTNGGPEWVEIIPNEFADWINQRRSDYTKLVPLVDSDNKGRESNAIFTTFSAGLKSGRDAWTYNFSPLALKESMERLIETYEAVRVAQEAGESATLVSQGGKDIKWDGDLKSNLARNKAAVFTTDAMCISPYRPFVKQYLYYDRMFNQRVYRMPQLFPKLISSGPAIVVSGVGVSSNFSCLMTNLVPDLQLLSNDQVLPLFWYEESKLTGGLFENSSTDPIRRDGISSWAVDEFTASVGGSIERDEIFFYTYGVLHSHQFHETYEDNLAKERPRIPLPKNSEQFDAFVLAGRSLSELHLGYESVEPYPLDEICTRPDLKPDQLYKVTRMTFPKGQGVKDRPTAIRYNDYITVNGIPDEAWDYVLSGKAALYWIVDRYRITKDKESGIVSDPNEYSEDPRYILDLLKRVVTVSVKTLEIVRGLPRLTFD